MLEKELAKNVPIEERAEYLNNICDGTESMSYARQFTPEEMAEHRELLSNACIMLEDIEREKKSALTRFKDKAKQYEVQRKQAVDNLRMKSEVVLWARRRSMPLNQSCSLDWRRYRCGEYSFLAGRIRHW